MDSALSISTMFLFFFIFLVLFFSVSTFRLFRVKAFDHMLTKRKLFCFQIFFWNYQKMFLLIFHDCHVLQWSLTSAPAAWYYTRNGVRTAEIGEFAVCFCFRLVFVSHYNGALHGSRSEIQATPSLSLSAKQFQVDHLANCEPQPEKSQLASTTETLPTMYRLLPALSRFAIPHNRVSSKFPISTKKPRFYCVP